MRNKIWIGNEVKCLCLCLWPYNDGLNIFWCNWFYLFIRAVCTSNENNKKKNKEIKSAKVLSLCGKELQSPPRWLTFQIVLILLFTVDVGTLAQNVHKVQFCPGIDFALFHGSKWKKKKKCFMSKGQNCCMILRCFLLLSCFFLRSLDLFLSNLTCSVAGKQRFRTRTTTLAGWSGSVTSYTMKLF